MTGRQTVRRTRHPRRGRTILAFAFVIAAAVFGALMLQKYELRRSPPQVPPQAQESGTVLVTLFFAAADSTELVREGREVDACEDTAGCIEEVIMELAGGPLGDLAPTLPPATTVRGVQVTGDQAVIDLGREFVDGLPSGSAAEMLAVYSLVDTVVINFPQIRQVSFLVEGQPVQTLRGHLDLSRPLTADFTLEQKAAVPSPAR